ncbi:MAG: polysaccharide deacetylase family protein [Bacteroidota bacterium]
MKYNPKIHNLRHVAKAIIGNIEFLFKNKKSNLIVLNYHGTPKKFLKKFEDQIIFLKDHFELIKAKEFYDIVSGRIIKPGPKILFTFDDGLKNNLNAVQILEKHGISGFFFIVPSFINSNNQKKFYIENIRQEINENIDSEEEDFTPLSWKDIIEISKFHEIGSHTSTHTISKETKDPFFIQNEIIGSKNEIETRIGKKITSFCSINNTIQSTNKLSISKIEANYSYHFTTLPGNNEINLNPYFIKRCNVESHWMLGAFKFSFSERNFKRYLSQINKYKKQSYN